jgi:glycosyltransferase involved in cell wall biosynthesis
VTEAERQHPTFSVALCTHNGARFVETQVRSILDQTLPPTQLVLSDDASADATVQLVTAMVENHLAAHPEHELDFVVIRNERALGVAGNFQQAILACDGELIALSDQDDVWVPERLAVLEATFAANPRLSLVHSDARLVDDNGAPLGATLFDSISVSSWERETETTPDALRVLVRRNIVTGATAVFRRELAALAMPIPEAWIHDEWLAAVAAAVGSIGIDDRPLVDYRQHGGNQIGAAKPSFRQKLAKLQAPRAERNRTLLLRAEQLAVRLPTLGAAPRLVALARGKVRHERFRSRLPANRLLRVVPVLVRAIGGWYRQFGMGAQDVLRDLVQPGR